MLDGIDSLALQLSSIYTSNTNNLSKIYERIATGKKINNPSDDFVGYIRAQTIQTSINGFEEVKQNLTNAKVITEMAVDVGNDIYEDLARMKEIAGLYDAGDADQQAAWEAEFAALEISVTTAIDNTQYDGTDIVDTGAPIVSVDLDPDGNSDLDVEFAVGDVVVSGTVTAFDLAGNGGAATLISVDAEFVKAANYLAKAESFDTAIDRNIDMVDTIIANKNSAKSLIVDINDVEELAKATNLQIRQQATIAMMAQSNISRQGILQLYT